GPGDRLHPRPGGHRSCRGGPAARRSPSHCGAGTARGRHMAGTDSPGRRPLDAKIAQEEVFGPAAAIFTVDSDDEAIEIANSTEMGLAAYVVTQDAGRAFHYAEHLETGIVGINDALPTVAFTPMGGTKQSGLGREGGTDG